LLLVRLHLLLLCFRNRAGIVLGLPAGRMGKGPGTRSKKFPAGTRRGGNCPWGVTRVWGG
jgi:hypothetical protein